MDKIIIWGAGKIGRGFIADIFHRNHYHLCFVDSHFPLIEKLNQTKQYSLHHLPNGEPKETRVIHNFSAIHTTDEKRLEEEVFPANLFAIAVFQNAFQEISCIIARIIRHRMNQGKTDFLNVLLCANVPDASAIFKELLYSQLSESEQNYAESNIGFSNSLLMRIVIDPAEKEKNEDPLLLLTNAYPNLVLDSKAFKGPKPLAENLIFSENMHADERRKMYTYNMVHAVFAYGGFLKNYRWMNECTSDPELLDLAKRSLDESAEGLIHEFGYSVEEMKKWNTEVMKNMTNPVLQDTIERVAANPLRKLSRDERLTGPALLCRKHGILPWYLAKSMAHACFYWSKEDEHSNILQNLIKQDGIRKTLERISGISFEKELCSLVADHYENNSVDKSSKDPSIIAWYKKAYQLGFMYEKNIRGCAQCLLASMFELTGKKDNPLYNAASAFSGGMALSGDGVCGGYSGSLMFIGFLTGRRMDMPDGDKIRQYKAYELAQKIRTKFIETYGSIRCSDIHKEIFGKSYILKTKEVRNEFEKAGAHLDKCTSVIGMAAWWTARLLLEEGLIELK